MSGRSRYADLDRETLIRLLERRDAQRQLGLVWERDEIEADQALNEDYVALQLDAELSHGDAPWQNLIIEGDNFDALRALRMSHRGKIGCIYIDPPYNTGNRDFVYNDRFVDKTHRFRHSLWLEFMYRRLQLAKELLADDGVIFVSIDDNELFRLGMLMDRVFGESNKLAVFAWQTEGNFDNQAKIKIAHEYLLAYAGRISRFPMPSAVDPNIPDSSKIFKTEIRNTIIKNGPKNPVSELNIPAGFPASFAEGVIERRNDGVWPRIPREIRVCAGRTAEEAVLISGWANKGLCEKFIKSGFRKILDTKGQETRFELTATGAVENVKTRKASHVISVLRNLGSTQSDSGMLADMGVEFTYPKPATLIKYILEIAGGKDMIILDFFAGSGTTAHAVARLNAEDGGNRRFILVSSTEATTDNPDKNLCRDVCAERVRRVMAGYTNAKGQPVEGVGGSFAYLRARRVPAHRMVLKLDHAEIWHALLLLHGHPLSPWPGEPLAAVLPTAASEAVVYLPDVSASTLRCWHDWLIDHAEVPVTAYCWSPARLNPTPSSVRVLPIPQHLRERFGR